ncbi:hypothetical protein [uncultured Clostridium sp.]|uniref:hypothetical protein n=1 Tax=uncultured Clostridium sp. TaxID=59620 RepID=UPI0025CC3C2F|nr:hypothetical protein [uncultured Clostridium sp.]
MERIEKNKILLPFTVFKDKKVNILIWFICIIMFSNLGIIFLVINAINNGSGIEFAEIFATGALYLNGVSLLASYMATIAFDFINQTKNTKFITYKTITLIISILLLAVLALGYSSIYKVEELSWIANIFQIIMYIVSIVVSLYIFSLSCMELDDQYDKYSEYDDNNRNTIVKKSNNSNNDGKGNNI